MVATRSTSFAAVTFSIQKHFPAPAIFRNYWIIRHNKKDGGMSIWKTILCEFKSVTTAILKMFDISNQFSEDWLHFNEHLCLHGKVVCLKYETAFFQRKSMLISTCRYLSLAVNYVFVDKNRTACGEQNLSKGSQSSPNWCAMWKIFKPLSWSI